MVPYEYRYLCKHKNPLALLNSIRSTGTYAPEFNSENDNLVFTVLILYFQVAGVVGRADVLAGLFFVGSFLCYKKATDSKKGVFSGQKYVAT